MSSVDRENAKKVAAIKAVMDHIKSDMIVGIGSGTTIKYAVEQIAKLYHNNNNNAIINEQKNNNNNDTKLITNITCIPTSYQAEELILEYKLPLGLLKLYNEIDVTIDGADEIDTALNLIKGGGGCHLQEKMIAQRSKKMIIIGDYTKQSKLLGTHWKQGIPISFFPKIGINYVKNAIKSKIGNKKLYGSLENIECNLRHAKSKAGPTITDEGLMIMDVNIGQIHLKKIKELDSLLHTICGVVETGIFVDLCHYAYVGLKDGKTVRIFKKD